MSITTTMLDYDYPGNFLTNDWKLSPMNREPAANAPTTGFTNVIPTAYMDANGGAIRVDNLTVSTGATAVQNYRLSISIGDSVGQYYLVHNMEIPPYSRITLIDKSSPVWLNSENMSLKHFAVGTANVRVSYTRHEVVS